MPRCEKTLREFVVGGDPRRSESPLLAQTPREKWGTRFIYGGLRFLGFPLQRVLQSLVHCRFGFLVFLLRDMALFVFDL